MTLMVLDFLRPNSPLSSLLTSKEPCSRGGNRELSKPRIHTNRTCLQFHLSATKPDPAQAGMYLLRKTPRVLPYIPACWSRRSGSFGSRSHHVCACTLSPVDWGSQVDSRRIITLGSRGSFLSSGGGTGSIERLAKSATCSCVCFCVVSMLFQRGME